MSDSEGLVCAYLLDGNGSGTRLSWDEIGDWKPDKGTLWVHLDYGTERAQKWLADDSTLPAVYTAALLDPQPRSRSVKASDALFTVIRGINFNKGADLEDMVSLRVWMEHNRIITLRHRRFAPTKDARDALAAGTGPRDAAELLIAIYRATLDDIVEVTDDLDASVDDLEDEILSAEDFHMRHRLATFRRQAISLRRYVAPQRSALARLQSQDVSFINERDKLHLSEICEQLTRVLEALDAARDRAAVTSEELSSRLSEQMDRRLYVLSMITALFLPLGLITGILGINVGGMPLTEHEFGFMIIVGFISLTSLVLLLLFRKMRWL